jgi:hypothetical protein
MAAERSNHKDDGNGDSDQPEKRQRILFLWVDVANCALQHYLL